MSTPNDSGHPRTTLGKATQTAKKVTATATEHSKRAFEKGVAASSRLSAPSLAWWGIAMAGVRKANRRDLTVITLAEGSSVAGVFTSNRFCAAPVVSEKCALKASGRAAAATDA